MPLEKVMDAQVSIQKELNAITREFQSCPLVGSEQRFQKLFQYSNDAIFLVEPSQKRILDANQKACSMLGYSHSELLTLPVSALHSHEQEKLEKFMQTILLNGSGSTDALTCRTKSGRLLTIRLSASLTHFNNQTCLLSLVKNRTEEERLGRENEVLHQDFLHELGFGSIIANSENFKAVLEKAKLVAPTDANVLITGESGTGKELVARAIHEQSMRTGKNMVRVNCASIPPELFESEFFGHVRGAFTGAVKDRMGRFEVADKGTLFLDEVGEIPLTIQGKLLRVLQDGQIQRVGSERTHKVDVRIIAATNRNIEQEVKRGNFRRDLYYRLSVFPIELPPLRERPEDIDALARHFIQKSALRLRKPEPLLTQPQIECLKEYPWPGNVRELQNLFERAMILYSGEAETLDLCTVLPQAGLDEESETPGKDWSASLTLSDLKRLEKEIIQRELYRAKGRVYGPKGAAKALGIKPTTLVSRMKKMKLN